MIQALQVQPLNLESVAEDEETDVMEARTCEQALEKEATGGSNEEAEESGSKTGDTDDEIMGSQVVDFDGEDIPKGAEGVEGRGHPRSRVISNVDRTGVAETEPQSKSLGTSDNNDIDMEGRSLLLSFCLGCSPPYTN